MKEYLDILKYVALEGVKKDDRTNTGVSSVFGMGYTIDLQKGFPLLTTKKVHIKSIIHELLWFISGSTDVKDLQRHGVTIWDEWADENGQLPETYSKQWSRYEDMRAVSFQEYQDKLNFFLGGGFETIGVDHSKELIFTRREINQVTKLIDGIRSNPNGRRHILNGWNVSTVDEAALPPCHVLYQFNVTNGKLSCLFYMRSNDLFLGHPFNIASAAFLTHMIAQQCGLEVGNLTWIGGDVHIYDNHLTKDIVFEQLAREPRQLPKLTLLHRNDIRDYCFDDFKIEEYDPHPSISAPVAV